jgi:tRNA nucleotidyltransferase (CCA-adding enzyme)
MQFVGRLEMKPDKELNTLCATMDIATVSRERIEEEFKKLLLKSKRPSLGFRWLQKIKRMTEVMPELAATKGIPQEAEWHPEGDVFEHTMQTIDAAATLKYKNEQEKLVILYAALCHDLGKVLTTQSIEGVIKSLGHEKIGEQLSRHLLSRITKNKDLLVAVGKLVRYHMRPSQLVQGNAKSSAYKRLARKLAPEITMRMLAQLSLADKRGRNPEGSTPLKKGFKEIREFLKKAEEATVLEQIEKPLLQGRDLLDVVKPGPQLGKLLKKAYQIQLREGIHDKEILKQRILKRLRF